MTTPPDPAIASALPSETSELQFTGIRRRFVDLMVKERWFLILLGASFAVAGMTYDIPQIAMWVGFVFAGYAVIANDSIQTIGTFIASNKQRPWWLLWLFIGGVMVVTLSVSFFRFDGDVSFQRLASDGFETAPTEFAFLQIAGPLFLLIVTRLRMPVSTTFLLLTSFATNPAGVESVLSKSVSGYGIAFGSALLVWLLLGKLFDRSFSGEAHPAWHAAQWLSTTFLWSMWLVQDAANVAVFLPRKLDFGQFLVFMGVLVLGLGVLFRLGGDKIQQVVDEKASVVDVRHATMIDATYGLVLFVFTVVSPVPMSTTWVFIGLLAGREIGIGITRAKHLQRPRNEIAKLIVRDLAYALIGLIISLTIAFTVNEKIAKSTLAWLGF